MRSTAFAESREQEGRRCTHEPEADARHQDARSYTDAPAKVRAEVLFQLELEETELAVKERREVFA